ncbi:glycoside hydrolase family 13 protein [uncultured Schumannella sp.]|uniref:glycoside hydrolase family 13 protein n=1 Tax=uncultured Schumannella sp. TaxID=1195956 RepID=UPI0025E7AF26|nr:glycoside hydrolase family 13 protein [uncultured Schumannella sp.]
MSSSLSAPHHDGSPLYVERAAPELGDRVRVRLRVPRHDGPALRRVHARSNPDHEPRWDEAHRLAGDHADEWWEASIEVANLRHGYRWLLEDEAGGIRWLNQAGLSSGETRDVDDFALVAGNAPPAWMTSSIMYEIFPDRFARSAAAEQRPAPEWAIPAGWGDPVDSEMPGRSQQFYGGDLDGITEHLDHLADLGVDLLYLNPFFPAASNHRYDAANFRVVDPLLGGDEALIRLVEAAHARGMRVIGDLTTNHSGDRHEWFRAAHGTPQAPESEFYYFTDASNESYESWLGVPSLPKFDWSSAELRRRFIEGPDSVVAHWLRPPFNLDGWRIDVANMTGRLGVVDLNAEVRQTLRRTMREINPDTVLLAESTNDATDDFTGDAWHGAMTYADFTRPLWGWLASPAEPDEELWFFGVPVTRIPAVTGTELVAQHERFVAGIPWRVRLGTMHALDTHDTARFLTHASPDALAVAVGLSVTLPGIPTVWMGDEFGLLGEDGEASRTPMPWGRTGDAAEGTFALYRELLALRRAHPVLGTSGLRWLHVSDDALLFVRESAEECVFVLAARGAAEVPVSDAGPVARVFGTVDWGERLAAPGPGLTVWRGPGVGGPSWEGTA